MSASPLEQVVAASEASLREHAVPSPAAVRSFDTPLGPDRAFVMAAIREGYELHYGEPAAFPGLDDDLRLLAGDSLYALGLARLAELDDLEAVAELADLISLCARVHAEGRAALAESLWEATATALSDGPGEGARAAFERSLK